MYDETTFPELHLLQTTLQSHGYNVVPYPQTETFKYLTIGFCTPVKGVTFKISQEENSFMVRLGTTFVSESFEDLTLKCIKSTLETVKIITDVWLQILRIIRKHANGDFFLYWCLFDEKEISSQFIGAEITDKITDAIKI